MSKSFFYHFSKLCLLILLAAVFTITGCGKRGAPLPPEGSQETFPSLYPPEDY